MAVFDNPQNVTGMPDVLVYLNTITQGWAGTMIWLVVTGGIFIFAGTRDSQNGILVTGFISTVVAVFLWGLGMINFFILFGSFAILIIGVLIAFFSKGGYGG